MGGGITGRKRPFDSSGGRKDGKPNKKKKDKKKGKGQKDVGTGGSGKGGSSYGVDHPNQISSSLDKTADKEGKTMAQVMSTFTKLEQSRFEAFRRVTFPADTVSKFVAHCLIEEQHRPVSEGVHVSTEKEKSSASITKRRPPILSEVCAPGQASEITMIVSSLAKSYAQRLVTAARQKAIDRITAQQKKDDTADDGRHAAGGGVGDGIVAITRNDVQKALEERRKNGIDPGFFLPPTSTVKYSRNRSILTLNDTESQQLKLLAALQAQDEYDKVHGSADPEAMDIDDGDEKEETNEQGQSSPQTDPIGQDQDHATGHDDDDDSDDDNLDDLGVDWGGS
mmetsp:Transcript_21863/g.51576  ORF Transcript_21863/g.51576 Transcript_21863/m.51576 type:complete len:338 (-) Transcript_21863:72-1085(-)